MNNTSDLKSIASTFIEDTINSTKANIEKEVDSFLDNYLLEKKLKIKAEIMKNFNNLRIDFVQSLKGQSFEIRFVFEEK